MIVDIWGIKTTRKNGIRTQLYCFLANKKDVLKNKKKGYMVRYTCDCPDCLHPDKIHSTMTSSLFNAKWNNINSQMCRSCRSRKFEHDIKKSFIPYSVIKKSIEDKGYTILTTKNEYDNAIYPSQSKISVICNNGHKYNITWNNWSKGKTCRKCYRDRVINEGVQWSKKFNVYKSVVTSITSQTYRKFYDIINPTNVKRGKNYHLDHKYSIVQGYKDKINPVILGSYVNLELIKAYDNITKRDDCSITKEDLFNEYNKYIGVY